MFKKKTSKQNSGNVEIKKPRRSTYSNNKSGVRISSPWVKKSDGK